MKTKTNTKFMNNNKHDQWQDNVHVFSCQEKVITALDVKMGFMSSANFSSPPDYIKLQ